MRTMAEIAPMDLAWTTVWPYPPLVSLSRASPAEPAAADPRPAGFQNLAELISAIYNHEARLRHERDRNPPPAMRVPGKS